MRTTKPYSFSIPLAAAEALDADAKRGGNSVGEHISSIVMNYLEAQNLLPEAIVEERALLRELRDEAIEKMWELDRQGKRDSAITLQTFQACAADPDWMQKYEIYIQGNAYKSGNPRKANANQTIGSRIKSELGAEDVLDDKGKPSRGRALGEIIQTYQLLKF